MTIHELLEYGPIVAHDEELDLLVTVNGAYFNLWVGDTTGNYTNTEAFATLGRLPEVPGASGLWGQNMTEVMDAAELLLDEILSEGDEEE